MKFLSAFLLALSSNLDNIGIGTSYGIRRIGLPFRSNLIVALVSTTGTIVSMCMGSLVAKYIQAYLANIIGSSIIVGVGAWIILQSWINPSDNTAEPVCQETSGSAAPQSGAEKILEFHIKSLGIFVRILREPWRADVDFSKEIDGKEAFLLALALTINNLASGFGGGIVGINIPFT
ncbi:hypothetical protein, partial [Desulfofundulus sp.]|uniref:hypothetical protein n=1 Tax=Desulfofundulus sp. TaxID=2282750 RepID=UPI003C76E013